MKKIKKKTQRIQRKKPAAHRYVWFGYFLVFSGVLLLAGISSMLYISLHNTSVLGQSTMLLSKGGDDVGSSGSGNSSGGSQTGNHDGQNQNANTLPPPKNFAPQVQQFISITPGVQHHEPDKRFVPENQNEFKPDAIENNKNPHNATDAGKPKMKKPDDLEQDPTIKDSLKKLDDVLKDKETDIEIGTTAADGRFTVKRGHIEAKTQFPLSLDPVTKELTISTPGGNKNITILPDKAVENLLSQNIVTKIDNASDSAGTTPGQIDLTQINNEPVFAIHGSKSKKLFGFFPVDIAKTAFISAQTGQLIKTDESFGSKLLEVISF